MKGPHPCGPFCFCATTDSLTRAARRYTMAPSRRTFRPALAPAHSRHSTGTLMKSTSLRIALAAAGALLLSSARGEEIASVNTNFHVTGSDRVVVEAYDDPIVQGVTCYVSRARTGGVKGTLGIAEDPTEASIACRQVGELHFTGPVKRKDDVFSVSMSLIFKSLHVVRVVDTKRNALVYLTYSDRVVSGSAKNSVSAVPMPTGTTIPVK
ncbi:CreA protein [Paraburkholderia sp. RAU6.4a]